MPAKTNLKDGDRCKVVAGTHTGKSGIVRDINTSKTGHVTITVVQDNGVRFKTLGKNVEVQNVPKKVPGSRPAAEGVPGADTLALYKKLVATKKDVELKGKTLPYTSYNGHMFSALYQDGTVGLRLPEADREAFIKKFKSGQPVQHGSLLKEYVIVPADLLRKTAEAKKYFEKSLAYVNGLKPKK